MQNRSDGNLDRSINEMERFGDVSLERRLYHFKFTIYRPLVYSEADEVRQKIEYICDLQEWTVIAPNRAYADLAFQDTWRRYDTREMKVTSVPVCAEINKMQSS